MITEFAGLRVVDKIVGMRPRGSSWPLRPPTGTGAGFVPVRKKGKLPSETLEAS